MNLIENSLINLGTSDMSVGSHCDRVMIKDSA